MLGAMALQSGEMTLDQFEADMKSRKISKAYREDVLQALAEFARSGLNQQVNADLFE